MSKKKSYRKVMDYHLAIPSYRRAESLGKKTLNFLRLASAPLPTIYVADDQDLIAYRNLYPEYEIVKAVKGMCAVRNWIQEHQPIGKRIVFMDDDIEEVVEYYSEDGKPKKRKVRDFNKLIEEA